MAGPTKGTLPKAYLRLDPNIDQSHTNPGAMVLLLCAANRQPHRGRFKSRALMETVLGRALIASAIARGDVVQLEDGRWYVPGWDEWQEGDLTVGERQKRIRARRNGASVTASRSERDNVTSETLPDRIPTPKALGSKALGSKATSVKDAPDTHDVMLLVERLTSYGFDYRQGHRVFDTLVKDCEVHGAPRLMAEYERFRIEDPGPMDPPQLVFGVHNRLHPFKATGPAPAKGKGFNPTSDEAWEAFGGRPDVA